MLMLLLGVLIILWMLGFLNLALLPISDIVLFNLLGRDITLYDVLICAAVLWLIGILPSPFRQIAAVVFIIWLLSLLGIIAIAGLPNVLVISLIVGLIVYLLGGFK